MRGIDAIGWIVRHLRRTRGDKEGIGLRHQDAAARVPIGQCGRHRRGWIGGPQQIARLDILRTIAKAQVHSDLEPLAIDRADGAIHPVAATAGQLHANNAHFRTGPHIEPERIAQHRPRAHCKTPGIACTQEPNLAHRRRRPNLSARIQQAEEQHRQALEEITVLLRHFRTDGMGHPLSVTLCHTGPALQDQLTCVKDMVCTGHAGAPQAISGMGEACIGTKPLMPCTRSIHARTRG